MINNYFVKVEELDDKDIQEVKGKYNFDDIKNEFNHGKVPEILEFFYEGADNEKSRTNMFDRWQHWLYQLCFLNAQRVTGRWKSMLINLETGNIFHDNFNMKESFYGFLLNQQDENK